MNDPEDPWVDPLELAAANARHDAELRAMGITTYARVGNSWNPAKLALRGKLTDKKINAYEKAGFYALEYKEARKRLMEKRSLKRHGNFVEREGRLVYAP